MVRGGLSRFRHGQVGPTMSVIIAAVVALASGVGAAIGVNRVVYGAPTYGYGSMEILLQFWGLAVGSVVAIVVGRVVLGIRLQPKVSRWVQIATALILVLVSLMTFTSGASLGLPTPLSPEGLWFYPAVTAPLVTAYFLFRSSRYRSYAKSGDHHLLETSPELDRSDPPVPGKGIPH